MEVLQRESTTQYFVQCDAESALEDFLAQVCPAAGEDGDFLLVAVLGGGCVTDSKLIADTIDQWRIPLVS